MASALSLQQAVRALMTHSSTDLLQQLSMFTALLMGADHLIAEETIVPRPLNHSALNKMTWCVMLSQFIFFRFLQSKETTARLSSSVGWVQEHTFESVIISIFQSVVRFALISFFFFWYQYVDFWLIKSTNTKPVHEKIQKTTSLCCSPVLIGNTGAPPPLQTEVLQYTLSVHVLLVGLSSVKYCQIAYILASSG